MLKHLPPERPRQPGSLARLLALLTALSATPAHKAHAQISPEVGAATSAEPEVFEEDSNETAETAPVSRGLFAWVRSHLPGLRLNFWDRDGRPRFNDLRAWIEPATLQVAQPAGEQIVETRILYELAPNFVEMNRSAGENYYQLEQRIKDELHRLWLEEFDTWPASFFPDDLPLKNDLADFSSMTHWSQGYELAPDQHISTIAITGHASPDQQTGSAEGGKFLNERLAKTRAQDAQTILMKHLPYLGVDKLPIAFEVPEFNEHDLHDLQAVTRALNVSGKNVHEQILNVIDLYNRDQITDSTQRQLLDKAVGEKRSVDLKITFDDGRQKVTQVPLPVLALAALYILNRLRQHLTH
ncbi:MAG: hypothetical protein HYV33_06245 [Candidatus Kerfeldbacteria bacterium]|nr:hypothetical protein [Candidatus Kerfeldbacteria bacterium]